MAIASTFAAAQHYRPVETLVERGVVLPARFDDVSEEYAAAREAAVVFDRSDRGLLVARGTDRKAWLHNLVTNAVSTLDDNAGNYAFATDVKGRVLFDMNVLCLPDALWLDIDRAAIAAAATHLDRHLITEDVQVSNASDEFARLGCTGPNAEKLAGQFGVTNFAPMPSLASVPIDKDGARLVRHDFTGGPSFELLVQRAGAATWWDRLVECGARPAGARVLDVLRVEAGIPWLGRDIDETVLPPETGQIERGISYHKGCYLGQEIIERMRARGVLAKRLVRLRLGPGPELALPAEVRQGGSAVGRITSLVTHPVEPLRFGLAYVKTSVREYSDLTVGEPPQPAIVRGERLD